MKLDESESIALTWQKEFVKFDKGRLYSDEIKNKCRKCKYNRKMSYLTPGTYEMIFGGTFKQEYFNGQTNYFCDKLCATGERRIINVDLTCGSFEKKERKPHKPKQIF